MVEKHCKGGTEVMADFKIAHKLTSANEGGLANSSADRGRLTYRGIASAFWPLWEGWPTVKATLAQCKGDVTAADRILSKDAGLQEKVDRFYKNNFWDVFSLDNVTDQAIANELFDSAVNIGVPVEARYLQRALNMLNRNGKLYPDLTVDGWIGPVTIKTLNNHPKQKTVLKVLNVLQGARYVSILEADRTQEVFAESWFSRVAI